MEKKRWVLIFSALCLALAFSVSPVEGQTICMGGNFCDRDVDGWIRDHKRCTDCLEAALMAGRGIDCDDSFSEEETGGHPCDGGDEDTTSGKKDFALRMTFNDDIGINILSDEMGVYIDNEGAGVEAAEHSQPNPTAGITLGLRAKPRIERQLFLDITCEPIPPFFGHDGINNCHLLPAELGDVLLPECEGNDFCNLGASVRPYKVNCPEGIPCPDIFTMLPSTRVPPEVLNPVLMSFRLGFGGELTVEVASNIDAGGALDPGRCLSLHPDPAALAEALCPTPSACNVSVTAFDDGSFSMAGMDDGENDEWDVVANGVTALMCIRGTSTSTMLGKATLTFGFNAIKKE